MTDRKIFDLFYGAREGDYGMCRRAYEAGADINFAFDGRRATKGGAGRWYVHAFCAPVCYFENHVVLLPSFLNIRCVSNVEPARALDPIVSRCIHIYHA